MSNQIISLLRQASEDALLFDIVAVAMQGAFFVLFLVPSLIILVRKWNHLDYFSRLMIIIYQIDMTAKLAFFILEYLLDDKITKDSTDENIGRALMRSSLFCINSLFLMSLHMFVQKL